MPYRFESDNPPKTALIILKVALDERMSDSLALSPQDGVPQPHHATAGRRQAGQPGADLPGGDEEEGHPPAHPAVLPAAAGRPPDDGRGCSAPLRWACARRSSSLRKAVFLRVCGVAGGM